MPKCTIDGKEVEFQAGENIVNIAKRVGVDVPVFCYHPGLTVVAQCRMCLVEVEKMPKLQTACSTPAADGMVIRTTSDTVKKARASTMEFLLVNHPLDCPVCDKSGECDLQDNSYAHGSAYMRSTEERRTFVDVDMGPVIQKNMNRCIHCTRCIRFGDEVAGVREMVAIQRGNMTDITTIDGLPLSTQYAGNYADICPTGALTLKDFRFKKRAWFLKKTPSVCGGCSKGCATEVHHEGGTIYRTLPRVSPSVNQYWLCDEGRFLFNAAQEEDRVREVRTKTSSESSWSEELIKLRQKMTSATAVVFGIGSDLTLDEMKAIQAFAAQYAPKAVLGHFGTPGISSSNEDGPEDTILRMKSKTGNLHGAEKLGLKPLQKVNADLVVMFTSGRAVLPEMTAKTKVGVGVFLTKEAEKFDVVLPSLSLFEKDGSIVNHAGTEQRLRRVVPPRGSCKAISEVLMLLANTNQKQGVA